MRYLIYSPVPLTWYKQEAEKAAFWLSQSRGRGEVEFVFKKIDVPRSPDIYIDGDGDRKLDWEWFRDNYPVLDYDGVGLHLTPAIKKKWRLDKNGSKHTDNKDYPEFWFVADESKAEGYPDSISEFVRLLIHEISHFDEDLDDQTFNRLDQDTVHRWDYDYKLIHRYPYLIDYRGYMMKRKIRKLMEKVLNLLYATVSTLSSPSNK